MERILVFSDTHGSCTKALKVIESMKGLTGIIHLGDIEKDVFFLKKKFPLIPFYAVCGNNDLYNFTPYELTVILENKVVFLTHGHQYLRGTDCECLKKIGKEKNADLVLYGHTHIMAYEESDGMICANPGSISIPRSAPPSYGILEIENDILKYDNIAT